MFVRNKKHGFDGSFLLLFQLKEFLMQYSKLTEMCFADCVTDFTGRTIKPEEVNEIWFFIVKL